MNLKEPCTEHNYKAISFFHPNILYSSCHLPKEVEYYFTKRIDIVKEKYQKYGDYEFHTESYETGQVPLGWINE